MTEAWLRRELETLENKARAIRQQLIAQNLEPAHKDK
jgi:hypothetical protein